VSLIVGYGTGGGYDVYGRLIARYLGRHIPGQPNVVVQNMPGAGSLRAANHLYTTAPKDGSTIATFGRDMPLIGIIGHNSNLRFDARKFTWLGSSSSYANDAYMLFVRKDAAVTSIADARRPGGAPLILGATGEGSTGNDVPVLLRDALGLNIKLIAGYPDGNAIFIAVDRKELDGRLVGLSPRSRRAPTGSDRRAACACFCSSRAAHAIHCCRTCRPHASLPQTSAHVR
jgi:tripartite-type tricarboxylate transporter receptor subunit TctC